MQHWIKAMSALGKDSRNLSHDEAQAAAHAIARGEATDAQTAAFLMALRMKGESNNEILGFVETFRKYLLPMRSYSEAICSAGPNERINSIPISIPVCLLLASVGIPHLLYGSTRLFFSRNDLIKPGIISPKGLLNGQSSLKQWEISFSKTKIGFINTDEMCPPLGRLQTVREELGVYTLLDAVERLLNPMQSKSLIMGVPQRMQIDRLTGILPKSGFETAYIVKGIDGSADLPIYKKSTVCKITPYSDESTLVDPATFGFFSDVLPKYSRTEQFKLLRSLQAGDEAKELKVIYDHIVFNTGLRLFWFEKVDSYEEGFHLAELLLKRGELSRMLGELGLLEQLTIVKEKEA